MSKNYFNVKKHRQLKKKSSGSEDTGISVDVSTDINEGDRAGPSGVVNSNTNNEVNRLPIANCESSSVLPENTDDCSHLLLTVFDHYSTISLANETQTSHESSNETEDSDVQVDNNPAPPSAGIREKLREWALRNSRTLSHKVVSELLVLLREEGYVSLPKTAQALLGTKHVRELRVMMGATGKDGEYAYLGIERGLQKIISSETYQEDKIKVIVHIDGMQIYKSSTITIWPITIKVYHDNYECEPFVAAIYCGNSKPHSVREYLHDFVTETSNLIENGLVLDNKKYEFEVLAITADSPARAYVKCVKAPGAFYACERCITQGVSVGEKKKKKRIYPEMDCPKRTKESFEDRMQPEHHHEDQSPLLQISNFDPTKMVVLDPMHLFYACVMKWLLEKWVLRNSPQRIKLVDVRRLQISLDVLTADVPCEFQRKKFDIKTVSKWKATQFRFFLHYCGPAVLKNILPENLYLHFLLLFVACRILNSKELLVANIDYADGLLRRFFQLLASMYGPESQVLSMHNLIHVADDVRTYQIPLADLSAFWGENYLGIFKHLVRTPHKPLTQIMNRLEELESGDQMKIRKRSSVDELVIDAKSRIFQQDQQQFQIVSQVKIRGGILKSYHPNNCVQLKNGQIFLVKTIYVKRGAGTNIDDISLTGYVESGRQEVFDTPTSSINVHVIGIINFSEHEKVICANDIKYKCVRLNMNGNQWVISLLHSDN